MKLLQRTIANIELPAGKTEMIVFDETLGGFGLRVRAGGARVWIFQYKIGRRNRRVTLGSATVLAPARAREVAAEMHAMVRLGRDPAGEKSEGRVRASETMLAVTQLYLTYQSGHLRRRSYIETERHLLRYCKTLHGLQLGKVDRRAVAARISEVASTSGAATGNRVRASLSALFSWAMQQGLCDSNPVAGSTRAEEVSRDRTPGADELKIIWSALGADDYSAIIKLLILTGCRREEVGSLCWAEITDDHIVLPPQRTKNNREHRVPITPAVRAILDGRARNGVFVFGRHREKPFTGWGTCRSRLDQRIKAAGHQLAPWRLHDFRRSLSTTMHERLGIQPHIVESILNHVSGHKAGTAGVYNRSTYEREKHTALTLWQNHVLSVVEGRERKVIPLHG